MATKKKVTNPLDFPKEIFVYDEEYWTRKDEIETAIDKNGSVNLEDIGITDPLYIADKEFNNHEFVGGTPIAKYVLVAVGVAKTSVDFKKV